VKETVLKANRAFIGLCANATFRYSIVAIWMAVVLSALYLFFFKRTFLQSNLQGIFSVSLFFGYFVYLVAGCLRGFTLIPSTYLVFLGIPFFSPIPLFALTLAGILISSACIYVLSDSMQFYEVFERKYGQRIGKIKSLVQRNELLIVIGWSFFPLAPTDLICYVCGLLKVDIKKFLLGILIGEGTISAIYIFFGDYLIRFFHLRA